MKKINSTIIAILFFSVLNAQNDSLKNIIKFNLDLNSLVKGDGFDIGFVGFERAICKRSSLALWLGYDFNSSNLIVDNIESVISSQTLKINFDYHYYFSSLNKLQGFYAFSSLKYSMGMTNKDNERIYESSASFGLGYQQIWKHFVADAQIDKGYSYSTLKNSEMKFISSSTTPFNITFSVGYFF